MIAVWPRGQIEQRIVLFLGLSRLWPRGQERPRLVFDKRSLTLRPNDSEFGSDRAVGRLLASWPRMASSITLVGLSVDRFRAIVFPLRPHLRSRQVFTAIAVIWLFAVSIPLPVAVFSRVDPARGLCMEVWPDAAWQLAYTASLMALQYFVPLAILIVCYSTICYIIWIKKPPGEAENARDRRLALSKRKVRTRNSGLINCIAYRYKRGRHVPSHLFGSDKEIVLFLGDNEHFCGGSCEIPI